MFMVGLGVGIFVGLMLASWFALALMALFPRIHRPSAGT